MTTIYDARSVNPDDVTDEQIAEVFAEYGIVPEAVSEANAGDFFQAGRTYRRHLDTFRCAAVGLSSAVGGAIAVGYMPITLAGESTWEVMFRDADDWLRGWTEVDA